jgi:hypothetical protein
MYVQLQNQIRRTQGLELVGNLVPYLTINHT